MAPRVDKALTALTNGVVTSVVDGLSGVQQNFSYNALGAAAAGQVGSVTEINGTDSYTVSYLYAPTGDVSVKKYHIPTTPGASTYNDTEWQFSDYLSFGASGNRVPRTLVQLASTDGGQTWNPTSEEFDYAYDNAGRLIEATFAMTPQSGQTGYSPTWPAASRGRAFYQYDAGGRLVNLQHWWDVWNTANNAYDSTAILGNSCVYDPVKNQKIQSDFWSEDPATGRFKPSPDRSETYQYDPNTDYLTQANYGDGLPNAVQNWTYDAAGNRVSDDSNPGAWAYDALNRMTASPGLTYTSDLAGNRTTRLDGASYGWDALNRMTTYVGAGEAASYTYRADGMRVKKQLTNQNVNYRYDGSKCVEEDVVGGGPTKSLDVLGARRIDSINSNGAAAYPVYDARGDVIGMLKRLGTGSYVVVDERAFDSWGEVRAGALVGSASARFCGSLDHKQDDETRFIYMAARYYDPLTGRFASEDPALRGLNRYAYCANDPIEFVDATGKAYDIAVILENAWDVFKNAEIFGAGCIDKVNELERLQAVLGDAFDWFKRTGQAFLSDSEVDAATAPLMGGTAGMIEARIAELKADLAGKANVECVVAQLGMGVIDVMIFMLQNSDPTAIGLGG